VDCSCKAVIREEVSFINVTYFAQFLFKLNEMAKKTQKKQQKSPNNKTKPTKRKKKEVSFFFWFSFPPERRNG